MEFVTSKEHADEMVKSLLNMKQAIEFIQTMTPNSEVKKDGRNILIVEYNGTEIYFYKEQAEVVINGRGGEAFRNRNLGFCPKHMQGVFDCNVREINNKRKTLVKVEVWIKPENKESLLSLVKDLA